MTLHVATARISYSGPDRLDVTAKGRDPIGMVFAPSWALLGPARHRLAVVAKARSRGDTATADELEDRAWWDYTAAYTAEMRRSYRLYPHVWSTLLSWERAVLVCYCTDPERCHRRLLAGILAKLGAVDEGEVTG